jgi:hypothetical protein
MTFRRPQSTLGWIAPENMFSISSELIKRCEGSSLKGPTAAGFIELNDGGFMKSLLIYLGIVTTLATTANAKSTFIESNYYHIRQEGRVQVNCNDGFQQDFNSFWCEGSYMSPASAAYFKTDKPAGFHHVKLHVQNSAGSTEDQWRLNPLTGKTFLPISLWIGSGILELGTNQVSYQVQTKQNDVIEKGTFTTDVHQPPVRQCRMIFVQSSNLFDCQSPSFACRELDYPRSECRP